MSETLHITEVAHWKPRYPITDASILQCTLCGRQESGLAARTRTTRHKDDKREWRYPDCVVCGNGQIPIEQ